MAINPDVIDHLARLSHVGLEPGEVESLVRDMESVLHHIDLLRQVDTSDVEPTPYAVDLSGVVREDAASPSLPAAQVLANAPRRQGDLFQVQAVLE